jgi:hypothetical protein
MKAVIQQIDEVEGGITQVEKKAYLDLCEQAGCAEVHFIDGFKTITNE